MTSPSYSAEFTKAENPDCRIQMRGPIIKGDLERFLVAAGKYRGYENRGPDADESTLDTTGNDTICLDSPGGSLTEALRLAAHFYDKGVGTIIHKNQRCLSACSFMFMLGMARGEEGTSYIHRKMHPTAHLGFHRPEIALDEDKAFNGAAVKKSFDIAILSSLNLIEISNSKKPGNPEAMIPADLLKAAFSHRGQDFFYIDTIDKLGRWEIDLLNLDVELLPPMNKTMAWNACENQFRWKYDLSKEFTSLERLIKEYSTERVVSFRDAEGATIYEVTGSDDGLVASGCFIKRQYKDVYSCGYNEFIGVSLGLGACKRDDYDKNIWPIYNSNLSMFEPQTQISSMVPYISSAKEIRQKLQAYYERPVQQAAPQNNQVANQNAGQNTNQNTGQNTVIDTGQAKWQVYGGYDLKGGDLYIIRGSNVRECVNSCQNDGACSAATFDRWNNICILKDINSSSRTFIKQPKTVTFTIGDEAANGIQYSNFRQQFKQRKDRNFPAPNTAYDTFSTPLTINCEDVCFADNSCMAYGFELGPKICSLYYMPGEYFPSSGSVIGIKEQLQ